MNAMFKNPIFYYVMVPLCVAFWPVSVWTRYLPEAEEDVTLWADRKVEVLVGSLVCWSNRMPMATARRPGPRWRAS